VADRRFEQSCPSAAADALSPTRQAVPALLTCSSRSLSSITTSPATRHRRWFWPFLRRSVPRSAASAFIAFGDPLILSTPLSALHAVVLGPLPRRSRSRLPPRFHHCPRYPPAFDLIYFAFSSSSLYLYPEVGTLCATPSLFHSLHRSPSALRSTCARHFTPPAPTAPAVIARNACHCRREMGLLVLYQGSPSERLQPYR
jgi:hypothetical protein